MYWQPDADGPFPETGREVLKQHVAFYRRLDAAGRERFERNVQRVLADHRFITVGEAADPRALVLAAAGAAVLLHGRPEWWFAGPRLVRIHADTFDSGDAKRDIAGKVAASGDLELSTADLLYGWQHPSDAYNVAIHEFAHVLDSLDGDSDGVPGTLPPQSIGPWLELLRTEIACVRSGASVLDEYGAKNTAELFAVAVEAFYERPRELRRHHRALYDALQTLFAIDPTRYVL